MSTKKTTSHGKGMSIPGAFVDEASRLPHGIDLSAPGGVEKLLAFHRGIYGHAMMSAQPGAPAGGDGGEGGSGEPAPSGGEPNTPLEDGAQDPPTDPPAGERVEDLPEWAQRIIRDTRQEAGRYRQNAQTAAEQAAQAAEEARTAITQGIAQALGLAPAGAGDEAPTVESLTEQVQTTTTERDEARAQSRALAVDFAAWKRSGHHNVDPAALLDSRAFQAKAGDLDPAADDFQAKLDDAIKAAVRENSRLAASLAGGPGSLDHPGGSGEGHTRGHVTLEQASASAMSGQR